MDTRLNDGNADSKGETNEEYYFVRYGCSVSTLMCDK